MPRKPEKSKEVRRMELNRSNRIKRKQRRKQGLCTTCGKPVDRDGVLCSECYKKASEDQKKRREVLLSLNLCPICGVNQIFPPEKSCPECKAKKAISRSERIDYYREWERKKVAERRAKGLCPYCGKRPPDEGYKMCAECREKARKKYAKKEKPYMRSEWVAERRCAICGKDELVPNKRVCWGCYATRLEAVKKSNANTDPAKRKEWGKMNARIRGKYNRNYDKFT